MMALPQIVIDWIVEIHVEVAIFMLTLGGALVLRNLTNPEPQQKGKKRLGCGENTAKHYEANMSVAAPTQGKPRPCALMTEILDTARELPGKEAASRALALYSELRMLTERNGLSIVDIAQSIKQCPASFYSVLVSCAIKANLLHLVDVLLGDMKRKSIPRSLEIYESAMKQLAGQHHYKRAMDVFDQMLQDGLEPSAVTYSCAVGFAAEIGDHHRAAECFQRLSARTVPSIRAYMTMLRIHNRRQDWPSAIALFRDMQQRGARLDSLVLNIVFAAGVSADQLAAVEQLLAEVQDQRPPIYDVVSFNTLIKGYAQRNDYHGAAKVMGRMRDRGVFPNAITFNSVMDAAVRSMRGDAAWKLVRQMRDVGLQPDKFTASILTRALSLSPSVEQVQLSLELMREVVSQCDCMLKTNLYHAIVEAAAQVEDGSLLMRAMAQARQHGISLPAAKYNGHAVTRALAQATQIKRRSATPQPTEGISTIAPWYVA
mmetsp:Transcript_66373/g.128386  ORF Transcript_66373/g.128386 Transcript_66373/m.128386 type:complete len:487 (+) Transcript_66373:124-1584(+)